jgi:2-methylcitrate dehydratase PrpD
MAGDPIAARLASFTVSSQSGLIPPHVRSRAALHLLDAVGCGLAAVGTGAAEHATTVAVAQGGQPEATLLGAPTRVPASVAALANGTRCHALDFDDTHEAGICHSTTVVAPAALAVGEAGGRGGSEVLDAFVLGTEVALRIAIGSAEGLYARGFHPTGVCGAFGAAAAASRLLELDAVKTAHALGIVGSFAAGLFEYLSDGSQTKPLHAGWAAQAGVQAARLAEAGATGPATVVEGRFGFLASHTGSAASAGAMAGDLGETWELENVSIKPFPACHFVHSSTWAAAQLAEEHGVDHRDIAEVFVRIPAEGEPLVLEPLSAKHEPRTPYDAKFSLPFTVAHRLVHGRLGVSSFSARSIRDRDVLALASRVRGEPLSGPPPSRFAGGARIVTTRGDELDGFVPHAPGSPGNPLDDDWLLAKFRANAALAIEPAVADDLAEALRSLDKAPALDPVLALLGAPERGLARS